MISTALTQQQSDNLHELYNGLAAADHASWLKLLNHSQPLSMPPGTLMHADGGPYDHLFLLLEGRSRLFQVDENGREVTFLRNMPGELCPVNLQKLLDKEQPSAYVQAETAVHGLQLSAMVFSQLMDESPRFRQEILSRLSQTISTLTRNMQDAVFKKLDARLCDALRLMFRQQKTDTIKITHQKLANELGTTREVISRSLKGLEQKGCIKINRGQLTMVAEDKLD